MFREIWLLTCSVSWIHCQKVHWWLVENTDKPLGSKEHLIVVLCLESTSMWSMWWKVCSALYLNRVWNIQSAHRSICHILRLLLPICCHWPVPTLGSLGQTVVAGILHCIHTLYCKPSSCCCTPKLDWNFGSDRQAVFLFYRERCDCCQWGTHSGQHLTRTSCFPSPLPRPAHHYFVWMVALSHVCHTLWLDVKSLL